MSTYQLHLRCGYSEADASIESESLEAAVTHALEVARELMRHRRNDVRHWCIEVRDESGALLQQVDFARHDPSLDHLPADMRSLAERTAGRLLRLREVCAHAQRTRQASRALVARSKGQPSLVAVT